MDFILSARWMFDKKSTRTVRTLRVCPLKTRLCIRNPNSSLRSVVRFNYFLLIWTCQYSIAKYLLHLTIAIITAPLVNFFYFYHSFRIALFLLRLLCTFRFNSSPSILTWCCIILCIVHCDYCRAVILSSHYCYDWYYDCQDGYCFLFHLF